MNDVWLSLGFAGIFFIAMAFRGIFGYLKNDKIAYEDLKFSWKTFLKGMIRPTLLTLSTGAFVGLLIGFLKLVTASGLEISGLDQISPQVLEIGLAIADIGAIGYAIKEALYCFTLTDEQIEKIRNTVYESIAEGGETGIDISVDENGDLVAVADLITPEHLLEDKQTSEDAETATGIEEVGLGASENPLSRRLPNGDNDNGKGWQCSKYSWYLATGIRMNYAPHPDYGPCNGRDMVNYLINKLGWVHCSKQNGAIFAYNTSSYGHTGMVVDATNNIVNDANWTPLQVDTHYLNLEAVGATYCCPKDMSPTPTPSIDIKVGDTVLPIEWIDYNGKALKKTRDYYFVSQISGNRVVLTADSVSGAIYAAANASNLKKVSVVVPDPKPAPAPSPKPTEPIKAGDSVYVSGKGYSTSKLTGRRTKDFKTTKMKVISIANDSAGCNQYNSGKVGDASAITGWWPISQVVKA